MSVVIGNTSANNHAQLANGVFNAPVTFLSHQESTPEAALKSCRDAIFTTDPGIDRDMLIQAKGERTPGTCEWIVRHGAYQAWLRGDINLLWIRGGPGKGKTMISIFLTQQLARAKHHSLVYYFCSGERHDATTVLCGLLWQLTDLHRELTPQVVPLMEPPERCKATLSSSETLWNLFIALVGSMDGERVHVLIDGLDECNDKSGRWLARRLARYGQEATMSNMSVVVLSRHMSALEASNTIRLDPDHNAFVSADVKAYIKTRVDDLSLQLDFTEDQQEHIVHKLLQKSEGTFLWVGFVIEELFMKDTISEVMTAIEDLPTGLPAFYARMLSGIKLAHRELSVRLLSWLITTFRRPTIETLMDVLRCPTQEGISQYQATLDHIRHCAPMLVIQDQGVEFVHQSAKDCLLRSTTVLDPTLHSFHIDIQGAHLYATQRCLEALTDGTYLQFYALLNWPKHAKSLGGFTSELFKQRLPFFEEQSDARDRWWRKYSHNFRGVPEDPPPRLHIACFLGFEAWVQVILAKEDAANITSVTYDLRESCRKDWSLLQYATESGSDRIVPLLLRSGPAELWLDTVHELYLHRGYVTEYEKMVDQLLIRGADPRRLILHAVDTGDAFSLRILTKSTLDNKFSTAELTSWLKLAIAQGHSSVIEILIKCGADPNTTGDVGRTSLHFAVLTDNKNMASTLLARNADPNLRDGAGKTPLHEAATSGTLSLVKTLLSGGADSSIVVSTGETARVIAAFQRHAEVLKELLKEDVECIPLRDKGPPSYDTVSSAELAMLEDIMVTGTYHGSVRETFPWLTSPAKPRSSETSNADDKRRISAQIIHQAIEEDICPPWLSLPGRTKFIDPKRLTISMSSGETSANAEAQRKWSDDKYPHQLPERRNGDLSDHESSDDSSDDSSDHLPASKPVRCRFVDITVTTHEEASFQGMLCEFLYGNDDDNDDYGSWLWGMDFCSFLTLGAKVDDRDSEGRTFLSLVVQYDLGSLVQMALDFGADPNLADTCPQQGLEWTPLMRAVSSQDEPLVKLLLDHGADPDCRDEYGTTHLLYAVSLDGPFSLVQILLDGKANPNLSDWIGASPLSRVTKNGRTDIISLLQARGADLNRREWDDGLPF